MFIPSGRRIKFTSGQINSWANTWPENWSTEPTQVVHLDGNGAVLPSLRYAQTVDWRIILSSLALALLMASRGLASDSAILSTTKGTNPIGDFGFSDGAHMTLKGKPVAKFAQAEIVRYDEVISAATERAENEGDPQRLARYTQQLKELTHEVDLAKKAELQWRRDSKGERELFARENLKESIEALQESGTRLIEEMIAADRQDGMTGDRLSDRANDGTSDQIGERHTNHGVIERSNSQARFERRVTDEKRQIENKHTADRAVSDVPASDVPASVGHVTRDSL